MRVGPVPSLSRMVAETLVCSMKNNDLSDSVIPCILLVFEGSLGILEKENEKEFHRAFTHGWWDQAVSCWTFHELMSAKVWDVHARKGVAIEIVTFIGEAFGSALGQRIDAENLPVRRAWGTTVHQLARKMAYMPDLAAIYDPEPSRQFTWGGKGRVLQSVNQFGE